MLRKNEPPLLRYQAQAIGGEYGRFDTPVEKDMWYFNPTVMKIGGKRHLVVRKYWMNYHDWDKYRSVLAVHEIKSDMSLGPQRIIRYPLRGPSESAEDPRASIFGGRNAIASCAWLVPPKKDPNKIIIHQSLFVLEDDLNVSEILDIPYGGNTRSLEHGVKAEKNWLWFDHDDRHYFVYQAEPHIVCEVDKVKGQWEVVDEMRTHNPSWWTLGQPRGGTPPVRVGDHYLTFYHSSMPWKKIPKYGVRMVYFVGAYLFEAKPPFQIVAATRQKLLTGTWNEPIQEGVPAVVYPNGAMLENGEWFITLGVNDCGCGWVKVPHSEIEKRLSPV